MLDKLNVEFEIRNSEFINLSDKAGYLQSARVTLKFDR